MQQPVATAALPTARTTQPLFFAKAIEATWLVAAFLIPVAVMHENSMIGFIQMPKVFVMRTTGLMLIALIVLEWAFTANIGSTTRLDIHVIARRAWLGLKNHPARIVYWAALSVLASNVISFALSPVPVVSFWGVDAGWDTYGLFSVSFYFLFFIVVAARVRTRRQVERLVWSVTAASVLFSCIGILQHFGIDPFASNAVPVERAGLTFGNPIFGASVLLMTIPLTIAVFLPYEDRMSPVSHILMGGGLITAQLAAFTFTQSRGPLVGLGVALVAYAIAIAVVLGWEHLKRPAAILAVAGALTLVFNLLPVQDAPEGTRDFGEAVGSIAPDVVGGLNNRYVIWRTAATVYFGVPWVDTEGYPELPSLAMPWSRPVVGFGPDMFGYVYPMAGDTEYTKDLASHGHNFIVHTAIELGALGVLAYAFLMGSVAYLLFTMLRRAKQGALPSWLTFLLLALVWVLVGRVVEQIPGKAQIADLHLMWVLCGVVVALYVMSRTASEPLPVPPGATSQPLRRRSRTQRRDTGAKLTMASMSIPRAVLAGSVVLIVLFVWSTTVLNHVSAAITARGALDAQIAGRLDDAEAKFEQAIRQAPDSAAVRINYAQLLFARGTQASLGREAQLERLVRADVQAQAVADRNPFDQRAWSRLSEYKREIAVLAPSTVPDALHANRLLVELMPGFWQPRSGFAWTYVRFGLYEDALRVVEEAKDIRVLESAGANLIYYIQAWALEGLGRIDDAMGAARCSLAYQNTEDAKQILRRNGEEVGEIVPLTAEDLVICPEVADRV